MTKKDWKLLNALVFDTAKTLQDGRHATDEEWGTIADDLERAAELARAEALRLTPDEDAR